MKQQNRHRHLSAVSQRRILNSLCYYRKICACLLVFPRFSLSGVIPFIVAASKDFFQIDFTLSSHAVVQEWLTLSAFSLLFVLKLLQVIVLHLAAFGCFEL